MAGRDSRRLMRPRRRTPPRTAMLVVTRLLLGCCLFAVSAPARVLLASCSRQGELYNSSRWTSHGHIRHMMATSVAACELECCKVPECGGFTFALDVSWGSSDCPLGSTCCFLKDLATGNGSRTPEVNATSGLVHGGRDSTPVLPSCPAGFKANPSGPGYWTTPRSDPPVCNATAAPPLPCHTERTMAKCKAYCESLGDCVAFEVGGGAYGTNNSACYVWHGAIDPLSFVAYSNGGMVTCIKDGYPPPIPHCIAGFADHAAGAWTPEQPARWPPQPQPPDTQNGTMAACAAKCVAAGCVAFRVGGGAYGTNTSECEVWSKVNPLDWTPQPAGSLTTARTCMKAGFHPPPPSPPLRTMKMLTTYGGTPDQLHGIVNVLTADCCGGEHDACTNSTITETFGMKVLMNLENQTGPCGDTLGSFLGNIWSRGNGGGCKSPKGLCPDWEQYLDAYIAHVKPHVDSGKVFGIFLGDELVCGGIPYANLSVVAGRLKAAMPNSWIYLNECGDIVGNAFPPIAADGQSGGVPLGLDAISIDAYSYFGAAEVVANRARYRNQIYPKLHPHQRAVVTPGVFAVNCSGLKPAQCNQSKQEELVAAKLDAYLRWAQEDRMIYGMNAWHFNHGAGGPGFAFGAIDLPKALAELRKIGDFIRGGDE